MTAPAVPSQAEAPETPSLPDKPSALIRLALGDLRKCEASSDYRVSMSYWHSPQGEVCAVCLAGSVMAQTFRASIDSCIDVDDFDEPVAAKLAALDELRGADENMGYACELLGAEPIPWTRLIPAYSDSPEGFHAAMSALADAFEESGQ